MESPYFTPPRKASAPATPPTPPETPTRVVKPSVRRGKRSRGGSDGEVLQAGPRRSKRLSAGKAQPQLPPTPQSGRAAAASKRAVAAPRSTGGTRKRRQGSKRVTKRTSTVHQSIGAADFLLSDDLALGPIRPAATDDDAVHAHLPKVILAQDKLRHDPWKLLVMTTLLNKTAGRAVRPIFEVLMKRYPSPQALSEASIPDLANLLFPLGLFNQRAASLIRFSAQYLSFAWPTAIAAGSSALPDADANGRVRYALNEPLPEQDKLDVNVFYGSGVYASDSFRIYSPLLPGEGGPRREARWLEKRKRAEERCRAKKAAGSGASSPGAEDLSVPGGVEQGDGSSDLHRADVHEIDEDLSDEEDVGPEEWRAVRAGDKELRRYLRWRWAIEGIHYEYERGPLIERERDKQRLSWLLA